MLSRIAENLFWIGRYVERAEGTARILDVHIHHLLETPIGNEQETCESLLAIMGVPVDQGEGDDAGRRPLTAAAVTSMVAFDPSNPSSIVSSLTAARANARGVSEAISSEMWEALNVTYNSLVSQVEYAPYAFFRFVRERAALIAGLTESTMSHDDAWLFILLGRSLERVDMLARLLSSAVTTYESGPDWVVLLRSCSAHEAFLRTYRREPEPLLATEFLLLDRLFPRSIFCALSAAEDCLAELDPRSGRAGTPDEARRILGHLRTNLEYRRIDDLVRDLRGLLATLQQGCSLASAALAERYFRRSTPIEWALEGAGLSAAVRGETMT